MMHSHISRRVVDHGSTTALWRVITTTHGCPAGHSRPHVTATWTARPIGPRPAPEETRQ